MSGPLRAGHALDFTYRRSVGGATGRFLAGLARRELWGSRAADGRVVVPPADYDPVAGTPSEEFVRVGDSGVVRSWTWVASPLPEHRRDRPFAFALIQLDGADTALLHIVEAGDEGEMRAGMRVRADWRETPAGSISDIRAFVPGEPAGQPSPLPHQAGPAEVLADVRIEYLYEPGLVLSGFLRALGERRLEGGRCPSCSMVFVPPRVRCPACGTGPMAPVPVDDRGTIVSYTVVHVPVAGALTDPPFAWAWIRLDGADVPFAHLLGDVRAEDIFVGQPVQAVWAAADELAPTWESIRHFAPAAR